MKKNMFLRVASVLLVLTLLSTCAISGTFAKYVTTDSNTDTARVAKWGVTITANGTAFQNAYAFGTNDPAASAGLSANSVVSTENVVAPGTSYDVADATIAGSPEVAVRVTYASTIDIPNTWAVDGAPYFPIVITVNDNTYALAASAQTASDSGNNKTYATIDALKAAVENAIEGYSADYDAGADLSSQAAPNVSWAWAFEGASGSIQTNDKDTKLAQAMDAAASTDDVADDITFGIALSITISQLD